MADLTPSQELEALVETCIRFIAEPVATAPMGSAWQREHDAARMTAGGGGRARADIIDQLISEAQALLVHACALGQGVADTIEVAERRSRYNQVAATTLVRGQLETAALVSWLLEKDIGTFERTRRWLVWQFDDLASARRAVRLFADGADPKQLLRAREQLQDREDRLTDRATKAAFRTRPSDSVTNQRAAILAPNGKGLGMETLTALVDGLIGESGIYSVLSNSAHGSRWGLLEGLQVLPDEPKNGMPYVKVSPSGIEPEFAINAVVRSIVGPTYLLNDWCGSTGAKDQRARAVAHAADQCRKSRGRIRVPENIGR